MKATGRRLLPTQPAESSRLAIAGSNVRALRPRHSRTPISFCREAARASSMLAMLEQAISNTIPLAPSTIAIKSPYFIIAADFRDRLYLYAVPGIDCGVRASELAQQKRQFRLCLFGCCARLESRVQSQPAKLLATEPVAFFRRTASKEMVAIAERIIKGNQMSGMSYLRPTNSGLVTPMTVNGLPLSSTERPIISGSPPKRRRQK